MTTDALNIFVDFAMPADVLALLEAGSRGHHLVYPRTPAASLLAMTAPDPAIASADVVFGQPDPGAIADASRLKWIHVSSSGIARYDNAPFRAVLARRGIALSNSAGVYSEACALHALSFLLAQARNLPRSLQTRTAPDTDAWRELRRSCAPLHGQTALIVGYGAIGSRLAELLRPFDMRLLAYRRKTRGNEAVPVVAGDALAEALAQADHVIDILPDSAETRRFFEAARFAAMKPGAVFYNIGRGTTVDQDALLAVLRSGHVQAAWLDVTDPEPLPDAHPLRAQPNCFITPHVAGGSADEKHRLVRHFLENLARFTRGEPLVDRVA